MVAAQEVVGRRTHPTVEDRTPLRVLEQIEDAGAELAVDELGQAARRVAQLALELGAEAGERVAHQRPGLEALEDGGPQALGLLERLGVARGEAVGEGLEGAEDASAQG